MTTRAAVNILGSDGSIIDVASLGAGDMVSSRPETGVYELRGSLGMEPPPMGWGYVVNQMDADKAINVEFADSILTVRVFKDGAPADLLHSITLHISVEELPMPEMPDMSPGDPAPEDPLQSAINEQSRLKAIADRALQPLQDEVDIGEADDETKAAWLIWKKYRVALNKVPDQAGYPNDIVWPELPE